MFLLLRTEHTSFNAFLPNPILYSLFSVSNHYAKACLKTFVPNSKIELHPIELLPSSF